MESATSWDSTGRYVLAAAAVAWPVVATGQALAIVQAVPQRSLAKSAIGQAAPVLVATVLADLAPVGIGPADLALVTVQVDPALVGIGPADPALATVQVDLAAVGTGPADPALVTAPTDPTGLLVAATDQADQIAPADRTGPTDRIAPEMGGGTMAASTTVQDGQIVQGGTTYTTVGRGRDVLVTAWATGSTDTRAATLAGTIGETMFE
ncbi:hypothetical protein NG895_16605 [Aeoliella sp. ICT_H6.2]|uniref:Uncharacterized protein n=1 Tax=Aeoliella straminimaris TaxID=2954799 RepID=A0A9X2FBM6_9BACT|nr:hypothetical protein [Aeoliella straminimaris]MCO6045534.1 hypothetical protein [Aeoliella straminimaris]